MLRSFFLAPVIVSALVACTPKPVVVEPVSVSETLEEQVDPVLDTTTLPIRDVLEEGFCYDDVYGTYLRDKYVQEHSHELKRFRSSNSRRQHQRNIENRSLFYARSRFVRPTPDYFGALPVVGNEMVEFWIRYFKTRGRRTFIQWLVRAESFKEVVGPVLAEEGLPPEMFFLAMVESGFSNTAYSHKSATGTWQFMGPTARIYDLKIDHWVDERRDPVKSTVAAARYLKDLYAQFGDWYLAMAAYNAGPGKVRSAIRRSKSRDFWRLAQTRYLRNETKHYVPKVLAALSLAHDLKRHGFEVTEDPRNQTPLSWAEVRRPLQLSEVAKALDVPLKTLKRWNPEIIRDITPPLRDRPFYALRLPENYLTQWAEVEPTLPVIEVSDVMMYKIRAGDTLSQIARRYKTSIRKIKDFNPQLRARALRIGKQIAIPVPGVVTKRTTASSSKEFG